MPEAMATVHQVHILPEDSADSEHPGFDLQREFRSRACARARAAGSCIIKRCGFRQVCKMLGGMLPQHIFVICML